MEVLQEDVCWICRGPETAADGPLGSVCSCSLLAHKTCLLRWQIYSSGKADETQCRFCQAELPDWRAALPKPRGAPVMSIAFGETTYFIQARSQSDFEDEVRRLLCLPPDVDLDVTFECRFPGGQDGANLELHGLQAYDTAVFCASSAAAGHLAATSSSSSSSGEGAPHCSCGDGGSNDGSSDGSSSVWWWSDDDDNDDGSEERGLLMFSNAISAQLAECADGAVGVVTSALGSMLMRLLA